MHNLDHLRRLLLQIRVVHGGLAGMAVVRKMSAHRALDVLQSYGMVRANPFLYIYSLISCFVVTYVSFAHCFISSLRALVVA